MAKKTATVPAAPAPKKAKATPKKAAKLSADAAEVLTATTESALLAAIGDFPRVVAQAAELREPHRVARYVEELAGTYHRWYDSCRVTPLGDDEVTDLHRTRLWLNDAAGQVIRNGLGLLGVSAPDRM